MRCRLPFHQGKRESTWKDAAGTNLLTTNPQTSTVSFCHYNNLLFCSTPLSFLFVFHRKGYRAVDGFCSSSRCGTHGSTSTTRSPYAWVGNSGKQCPGRCAWPFHQPLYGPQTPPLVAPNNDVGLDGMVINLATLLAGTATNPFVNEYYQGPKEAPLEAATACPGVYGKGAYPGYPGQLPVDPTSGASYNAYGVNGRKFLLPALFYPSTSTCSTLV